jgi:hypothetical protein
MYFDKPKPCSPPLGEQEGVFLSPDPIVQNPAYTQNLNRYSYVLNNPLRYNDPTGYRIRIAPGEDESYINHNALRYIGGRRIGPGSGKHWSDSFNMSMGNFHIFSASTLGLPIGTDTRTVDFGMRNGIHGFFYNYVSVSPQRRIGSPGSKDFRATFGVKITRSFVASSAGIVSGLSFTEVVADIRETGISRFLEYINDPNYGSCFFIKSVDAYKPENFIIWKYAPKSVNYGRRVGRWGHQYFPNPDYGDLRHIIGSYIIAEKFDPFTAYHITWGNEFIGLGLDIQNIGSRFNGSSGWAFQFSDITRNYQGIWYSIIY